LKKFDGNVKFVLASPYILTTLETKRLACEWEEDITIHELVLDLMFLMRVKLINKQVFFERFTTKEKEDE
jgi:hypothetical protein